MPSITHKIVDLRTEGPVIEITVTPSVHFLQQMNISSDDTKFVKLLAMIDTGASKTVIKKGITSYLEINPVGYTKMTTPSSTNVHCDDFNVQILFSKNIYIPSIVVTEAPLQGQHIQCLIGRDILKYGVFFYNGCENTFTISF